MSLICKRSSLRWEASQMEVSRPNFKAEVHAWISSFPPDKYEITLADSYITVWAKSLTDVPVLLAWSTQHALHSLSPPTLTYSTGSWNKENLMTVVESFFQRNAYHPFAQCSHLQKQNRLVLLTEIPPPSAEASSHQIARCLAFVHTRNMPA